MERIRKLFGEVDLNWKKVIIMAIVAGVYTGIVAMLPITKDTSFRDIAIKFEVWILFGIFIICNSKSNIDSAAKCFVFFLISQPLVYLVQVPFSEMGWSLFIYYRTWFIWTLLTIPMGFIGYYLKMNKWWGLFILTPVMLLLGLHYGDYLSLTLFHFPYHLLSTIFCFVTLLVYPLVVFKAEKLRKAGLMISAAIILFFSVYIMFNRHVYSTILLTNGGSAGARFNDKYQAYLEDPSYGTVSIEYDESMEDYVIKADIVKAGKTDLIIEDQKGKKQIFELVINYSAIDINKK